MSVHVKVRVRIGGHLTRLAYEAAGASVDPVGRCGAFLSLYDEQDRATTTILWPAGVVSVELAREYEANTVDPDPDKGEVRTRHG